MKYKVGNTVCIKSMSDIGRIIDSKGCVGGLPFKVAMNNCCSSRMTIDQIDDINGYYRMKEDPWHFYNDEMIERLVEDILDNEIQEHQRMCDEIMDIQGIEPIEAEMEHIIHCPDGYIFKDENGNVINATKIVLEKKKKEYPKTYKECCKILGVDPDNYLTIRNVHCYDGEEETIKYEKDLLDKVDSLWGLRICRDAYWKIAGDEMGLGKPWEPSKDEMVYSIYRHSNKIGTEMFLGKSVTFEFPTSEMRDAFKENFDPDIEFCKELL